jgi:hypothetical protein
MDFQNLLLDAQTDKLAKQKLIDMYRPLLVKESIVDGRFDEDLFQELVIVLLKCIKTFQA